MRTGKTPTKTTIEITADGRQEVVDAIIGECFCCGHRGIQAYKEDEHILCGDCIEIIRRAQHTRTT